MTEDRIKKIERMLDFSSDGIIEDVIISDKEKVKNILLADKDLLELLQTPDVDININPDACLNNSIYSHLRYVPQTQSVTKNFILFDIDEPELSRDNEDYNMKTLTVVTVCHESYAQTDFGIDRQDLMAFIIKDLFSGSNVLGLQLKKTYDVGGYSENGYLYRTMKFYASSFSVKNYLRNFMGNKQ